MLFLISHFVLRGIKVNQQAQYELFLENQGKTANTFLLQNILSDSIKVPQTFLRTKGTDFAKQLELISGQQVVLYDIEGNSINKKLSMAETENIRTPLDFALDHKTSYMVEYDALYYFTPLIIGNDQVGVIQFYYSLSASMEFYNQIKSMFFYIGGMVFIGSFILAYFYFNYFANGIIKLLRTVDQIGEGHYDTPIIKRRDEMGRLSIGINKMSGQIKKTIQDMENEQNKLTLAVNKLSLVDKEQKQFIGNVTHEFKTPLTSIKAYIDLLEMYPDDPELLNTSIVNIKSETLRLYEMVDKVLQLSALEKYDFEYNKERINIKDIIQSVIRPMKGKIEKFGLSLDTELADAFVEADKDSMVIILVNLLDNAIKYNKEGGSIKIRSYILDSKVIVEISDTGIGIPSEVSNHIFDPFFTVDKNRARENGGAGLGLSLVKKHVLVQDGLITLVNTDAEGTTFRIAFPKQN
ncbi:MAG: hypothetical protein K0S61_4579 [Anaerocolumna sp.]|nr:hypothetical protein [Anaerocolumna sp.]